MSRIVSTCDKRELRFPCFAYDWNKTGFEINTLGDCEAALEIKLKIDKNSELKM